MANDYLEIRELYHHGIKGQKWGVRRFQNEDGTLTDEGKRRYFSKDGSMAPEAAEKFRKDFDSDITIMQQVAKKQDPSRRPESTGKNWDKTYKFIDKEIKKFRIGKKSIFDNAKTDQDLENILADYYVKASLKDLGLNDRETESALSALANIKHSDDLVLSQSGIKGQKWGIRRYQNPDGTLTEAGKERYGVKGTSDEMSKKGKEQYDKDIKDSHDSIMDVLGAAKTISNETANLVGPKRGSKRVNKKDYSTMSDEELRKKVNRLQMERQYGDLTGDNKYVMTGREKVRETLQTVGSLITIAGGVVGIAYTVNKLKSKVPGK